MNPPDRQTEGPSRKLASMGMTPNTALLKIYIGGDHDEHRQEGVGETAPE